MASEPKPSFPWASVLVLKPHPTSASGFGSEDINTGSELRLSEEQTYGFVLDRKMASGDIMEFYYSKQPSSLLASGPVTPGALFDIDVEYYHLGGKYSMKSNAGGRYSETRTIKISDRVGFFRWVSCMGSGIL